METENQIYPYKKNSDENEQVKGANLYGEHPPLPKASVLRVTWIISRVHFRTNQKSNIDLIASKCISLNQIKQNIINYLNQSQ